MFLIHFPARNVALETVEAFLDTVIEAGHDPFFSSEKIAAQWCNLRRLFVTKQDRQEYQHWEMTTGLRLIDTKTNNATVAQLNVYRTFVRATHTRSF